MKKYLFLLLVPFLSMTGYTQSPTPPSNIYNLELRNWLRNNWYNGFHNTLGYSSARQEMYSYVDNEAGQVYCVYTGFHQDAEFTSYLNPINAEHTVPQSFFDSAEPMKSDLHHLFPTHQEVNTARSNLPFAEINDSFTDKWFIGTNDGITQTTSIPNTNIDQYSELNTNSSFEPREDHKGNVARAIFYFFTMYPTQAGSLGDVADLETLYQWHLDDPVDAQEIIRNNKTQEVQGNYNPYIYTPDLVDKAWGFYNVGVENEQQNPPISIFPNPASNILSLNTVEQYSYKIISVQGKTVDSGDVRNSSISIQLLPRGEYTLILLNSDKSQRIKFVKK